MYLYLEVKFGIHRGEIGYSECIGSIVWFWYCVEFKEELYCSAYLFFLCLTVSTESFFYL